MKKAFRKAACLTLSALSLFSVAGCGGESGPTDGGNNVGAQIYDPETRPLVFSTSALDGNFNPFYATAATDVSIVAQTQISMLGTDSKGNVVSGNNYATVALDHKVTEKGTDEDKTTEYEFVIKNGIKFSDGKPLDIDDVLFNLYVYLDPMYMGSSTIYSTKIKGLEAYRTQDPTAVEGSSSNAESADATAAVERIIAMQDVLIEDGASYDKDSLEGQDIELMKTLYAKAVQEEWTAYASLEPYKTEYRFTDEWQAFYFAQGFIGYQYEYDDNQNRQKVKKTDAQGEYFVTTLDVNKDGDVEAQPLIDDINEAVSDSAKVAQYMADNDCDEETAKDYIKRDTAIAHVYESNTTSGDGLLYVLSMQSGGELYNKFVAEAMQERLDSQKVEGQLIVPSISGITTYATTNFNGKSLGQSHDVLKIVIDGVDPKAIWNFAFAVAPMHYYSSAEMVAKANRETHFGVDFGNKDFFESVLQQTQKNRLPVGAGTYMATDRAGNDLTIANDGGTEFYKNYWVYYKRNPYFETVGTGLCNAKIKYMRYKVVGADQLLNSVINKEIDVSEPNATQSNISRLADPSISSYLGYFNYLTNGYGYVGINPKFVDNINVRRAIMKSLDVTRTIAYYTEALATQLYRPMSITCDWAYPKDATAYYEFTRNASEINAMLAGVPASDKKLTFTIAGETVDHPAYGMFQDAAEWLNANCGFDITVTTDVSALKKLATGNLEVWAAAWSSPIDPDMYQVYHKDSKATSVKNWGYDEIVRGTDSKYAYERSIVTGRLATLIEWARETTNQDERADYYAEALDLVMELAIELPTYQRNDLVVYNKSIINRSTLNTSPSPTSGVFDRIWEVNYN